MTSNTVKVAAALLPAAVAVVTKLGMPALGTLALLAVLVLAATCWATFWVIGSQARTDRVSQILLARRGTPAPAPVPEAPSAEAGMLKRKLQLVTSRKRQRG